MAQPQAYNRKTDFTERDGDDTNHAGVNTELDAAALSINEIRDKLALIQRDDGALKNGIVTAESLSDSAFNAVLGEVATATAAASAAADRSVLFSTQSEVEKNAAQAAAQTAAALLDNFDDRYLGSKTTNPTTDNDGNALVTGALYFNSVAGEMRVWAGTFWKATGSSVGGTINTAKYTATAGQTTFAIVYDVGFVHVYLNGVKLESGVEFTANNGTSVVLATGATAGDVVDMIAFGIFSVANTYTKAEADALLGAKANQATTYTKFELNAANGSSLLGFQQSGTGAVQRTAQDKMRETISLMDFGADPTGVQDSTTAWNNFQSSTTGRKLIPAGTYRVNSLNRVYLNDVIEDDIQRFPPGYVGTVNQSVEKSFNQDLASFRVGGSDATPLNDERNYWRGLSNKNAWGNNSNIGLFSVAFNRNNASYASYSTSFGHDCVVYGVAGGAGGAGSCCGDPDNLITNHGYCSIAWGKNVLAAGSKSAAFCEETIVNARAGFAAGYASKATTWISGEDGIGAIAMGREAWALGNESVAYGAYLRSYNGAALIGCGINSGNPMVASTKMVGFGANVVLPTIQINPGNGTVNNFGSVTYRGGLQMFGPEYVAVGLAHTVQSVTNAGGGKYGEFHIKPLVNGAISNGWTVDAGRTGGVVSLYPTVDGIMRLGAASFRPEVIFSVNGTINTSDAREKQQIRELTNKELAVAIRLKSLVRAFKWNSSVAEKGDKARIHIGVIAQDVKAAFEAEGLVAEDYSVLCYDKWDEQAEVRDSDGNITSEYLPKGDRYGVRYEPLLAFIIAAM